jgi:hypothetical protein
MFDYLKVKYVENGTFILSQGESVNKAVTENNVPNDFGIYLIYADKEVVDNLVYVGKAGSVASDGSSKKQGLSKRLVNQHSGMKRSEYFVKYMADNSTDLVFHWFKTYDELTKAVIPALAEAEVIQKYFLEYRKLPELNKSF